MNRQLEITIVGLSNYVDDYETFVRNLAAGTQVLMMAEPSNAYDKNAVKAFVGGKHVGYVARDMAKQVLPYIVQNRGVLIGTSTKAFKKEIHIVVDISKFSDLTFDDKKMPLYNSDLAFADNLIAPLLSEDEKFLMDLTLAEFYLTSDVSETILESAIKEYMKGIRNSLSVESTSRWLEINQKISERISLNQEAGSEKLEHISEEMTEYNKDRVRVVSHIYDYKYNKLRQEVLKPEGTLQRILKAEFGTTELNQEQTRQLYDKVEHFMLSLPNNIYRLLYEKPAEWAKALMYLRPSLHELYIICTHAIVLDWAKVRLTDGTEAHFDIRDLSLAMIDREKIFNSRLERDKLISIYNRMKTLISGFGEKADFAWLFIACCNLNYLASHNAYSPFAKTLANWQLTKEDVKVVANNIKINVTKMRDEKLDPERKLQVLKTIADFENFIK